MFKRACYCRDTPILSAAGCMLQTINKCYFKNLNWRCTLPPHKHTGLWLFLIPRHSLWTTIYQVIHQTSHLVYVWFTYTTIVKVRTYSVLFFVYEKTNYRVVDFSFLLLHCGWVSVWAFCCLIHGAFATIPSWLFFCMLAQWLTGWLK